MRLKAHILHPGKTAHFNWDAASSSAVPVERPVTVELVEDGEAAYLLRLNADGVCVADSWHENVAAAKAQAAFEYEIDDEDWSPSDK